MLGSGCIGLCTLMCLKARVFNSRNEDIVAFAKSIGGVDQVYECAGNRITTLQTARCIKKGGKIPLKKIVSHVFDFKDCIEAIDYSMKRKDIVIICA